MGDIRDLLENNRRWAAAMQAADPRYFETLAAQQAPEYLWIGCSDSRVPANVIAGLAPGEVFVHRNVANLVVHSDLNCLAVVEYAVEALRVRHIIVCGHYGCGGVRAALEAQPCGLAGNWLGHVRDIALARQAELAAIADDTARVNRLCEMNVEAQVAAVGRTSTVQAAWARGARLSVHGWIYGLDNGVIEDLDVSVSSAESLQELERRSKVNRSSS